jgi:tRNA/rRNA methyltransferase
MKINLDHISMILHQPHYPENIGAAARAAKNMGIHRLVVVSPRDCDLTRILKMATHAAEDVIADMEIYDDLRDALATCQYIVGATARSGSHRKTLQDPKELVRELVPISQQNRVGILFGPEDRGLSNLELKYCHTLVTIPTAEFASLNLAQAVMVLAYEIFLAGREKSVPHVPRLANSHELENMYDHLQEALAQIHFLNPENPEYWMFNIRRFFSRIGLQAREVKIVRGICRQLNWYFNQRSRSAGLLPAQSQGSVAEKEMAASASTKS